jgi:predicted RNase H-like HicB family nuclease
MEYAALFEPAKEGGFVITIPDFGWGVSQGDTEEEAREMAIALLQTLIQEHIRRGEPLPRPTKPRRQGVPVRARSRAPPKSRSVAMLGWGSERRHHLLSHLRRQRNRRN